MLLFDKSYVLAQLPCGVISHLRLMAYKAVLWSFGLGTKLICVRTISYYHVLLEARYVKSHLCLNDFYLKSYIFLLLYLIRLKIQQLVMSQVVFWRKEMISKKNEVLWHRTGWRKPDPGDWHRLFGSSPDWLKTNVLREILVRNLRRTGKFREVTSECWRKVS